jgi:DNA-binding NtrC family response regulator
VRELQHVIEMLVLFSDAEVIDEADLPRALRRPTTGVSPASGPAASASTSPRGFAAAVEDFERTLLKDAIAAAGGVKAEAARRLGLDANQIKYLCRKYGL